MIEPTDEMEQAYEAAWEAVAASESVLGCTEHNMGDCPYHEVPGARRRAGLAALLAIVERDYAGLLRDLTDPDPCWFDHHGHCQAHGWPATDPRCPHARAKALLDGTP